MENLYQVLEGWLSKLSQGSPLAESKFKLLCDLAGRETFLQGEINVLPVSAPVTVCGDIHGTCVRETRLLCDTVRCEM